MVIAGAILSTPSCQRDALPPQVSGVTPSSGKALLPIELTLQGANFEPLVRANLDDPSQTTVDRTFRVVLFRPGVEIPLENVQWVDRTTLRGTLPAGNRAPASYGIRVIDPRGLQAEKADAFRSLRDCGPSDSCPVVPSPCRSATGTCLGTTCEYAPLDAGTACATNLPCAQGGMCDGAGSCVGTGVACTAPGQCQRGPGVCLDDGGCAYPAADAGDACDDGRSCTAGDICDSSGSCAGQSYTCTDNTPPLAWLDALPPVGPAPLAVTLDAGSADQEDPPGALRYRFSFEGDPQRVTPFGPERQSAYGYATPGVYRAYVEVRDSGGISAFAQRLVTVVRPDEDVLVTTAADEDDPGATPASPGGTGLSLREAIRYVSEILNQPRTIRFSGPMTLASATSLPVVAPPGTKVVGAPGVALDFRATSVSGSACFTLGTGTALIGVEAYGCGGSVVRMEGTDTQVAECRLHTGGKAMTATEGVMAAGTGGTFGPRNVTFGFTVGLTVSGSGYLIIGNLFRENQKGVFEYGSAPNTLVLNDFIENYIGVLEGLTSQGPTILFNTFARNQTNGFETSRPVRPARIQNNIFASNGFCAIKAGTGDVAPASPNGFFQFSTSPQCLSVDRPGGDVVGDPRFLNPDAGDYRLGPTSPMINRGADAGVIDVNGPAFGLWTGSAPDLGAHESPYGP